MFFSLTLLFLSLTVRAQSLGPHLRLDKKEHLDLKFKESQIIVLTRFGCSFCQEQLQNLSCFKKEDVVVLFDGTEEEWKKEQRRHPHSFPSYLSTTKSLGFFKKNPVYPTSLRLKGKKIFRYKGVKDCKSL